MRRGTLVAAAAAVALVATALVALPAAAQDQEVTATAAATGTSPPAKPLGLHASASHDAVTLTWTASVDPTVTHYAILRRDPNTDALGVFAVIEPNAGAGTSYTDSSVSASGSYVYRVKSVSPTGVSKWSGYRRADTPAAPPPPTTTTQPPVPEPVTLKLVKIEPPPPPDPDPDPDIFLPSTQGEPPLIPRAQLVIQTDQDANPVVPLDWALKPSGLTGGDQFRLLFTTHTGSRAPDSTDIADYNTYVQGQANAGSAHTAIKPYASGFRVVGSTADVDARDNTSTRYTSNDKGVPIYWLNGNKVADDYEDFYDSTWDDEANSTRRDGAVRFPTNGFVFTGSRNDGRAAPTTPFGASAVEVGRLSGAGGPLRAFGTYASTSTGAPYYALSKVFTVAGLTLDAGQRFENRYAPTGVPAGDPARLGLDPGAPPAYANVEEILARSADDFVPRGVTATAHEDGIRVRWQSSGQLSACTPIPGRSILPEEERDEFDYHRAGYDIERVPGTQVVEKFTHPSGYNAWRVTETGASWKYRCVNRAFLVGYEVYRTSFGNVGRPSDSQPYRVAYVPINAPGGLVFDDRSSDALAVPRVHNYQVRALYVHERDITGSGAVRDFRSRLSRGTWISRR